MSQIHNSELIKNVTDIAKLQIGSENAPNELGNSIIPIIDISPRANRLSTICKNATATNATSATIYTTPTDKDFYLTACSLNVIKDVTATSTASSISFSISDGSAAVPLKITCLTLTVQNLSTSLSFPFPLLLARGTAININNGTNVANVSACGSIIGYETYNSSA